MMAGTLNEYAAIVGEDVIDHLRQLAKGLQGSRVVHVNSTREGGGVAEILQWLVPLENELGLDCSWEVISGDDTFYQCTKNFHNALQGNQVSMPESLILSYEETNRRNAEELRARLEDADFVFIHDPQPALLLESIPNRKGKWVWRCHVDVSHPYRPVWKYLRGHVRSYDASIWSLAEFTQPMPHPLYLIPPSIDPLSDKNKELEPWQIESIYQEYGIDPNRPLIVQISRFDRFKDPLGVIRAFKLASAFAPLQLVLAGGGASDDPEGEKVLEEVREAANNHSDIHVLMLPPDANITVNALQRMADIVVQKSIREGFGLTVTEGMWKGRAVIGGDTGGIRLQVINHHTGFLVNTPEGAALRIRYLLKHRDILKQMGRKARQLVLENFLLTRQLREHLTLMLAITHETMERIEL